MIGLFALGPLQIQIPGYANAQILAMSSHRIQLYNLVLYDVFKTMKTRCFILTNPEKVCSKNLRSRNFKQKLRYQLVKAEAVEAEALRMEAEAI